MENEPLLSSSGRLPCVVAYLESGRRRQRTRRKCQKTWQPARTTVSRDHNSCIGARYRDRRLAGRDRGRRWTCPCRIDRGPCTVRLSRNRLGRARSHRLGASRAADDPCGTRLRDTFTILEEMRVPTTQIHLVGGGPVPRCGDRSRPTSMAKRSRSCTPRKVRPTARPSSPVLWPISGRRSMRRMLRPLSRALPRTAPEALRDAETHARRRFDSRVNQAIAHTGQVRARPHVAARLKAKHVPEPSPHNTLGCQHPTSPRAMRRRGRRWPGHDAGAPA